MISRQNVIKFCWKDKKFLSCSAMKMVQLKRSKAWMHHRFFENSSSSRWLTSGKGGSRGRSQGRNLLFKNFKTVKLLGGDSWKNPLSSSRLLTLGKGGLRGRSQGRNCLFQNLDGLEITWGKDLKRASSIFVQVTHIGQRGFKRNCLIKFFDGVQINGGKELTYEHPPSSSRWLTSGKGGSRGRSLGRIFYVQRFQTHKIIWGDS